MAHLPNLQRRRPLPCSHCCLTTSHADLPRTAPLLHSKLARAERLSSLRACCRSVSTLCPTSTLRWCAVCRTDAGSTSGRLWRDRRGRTARWPDLVDATAFRMTRVVLAAAHPDGDPTNNRLNQHLTVVSRRSINTVSAERLRRPAGAIEQPFSLLAVSAYSPFWSTGLRSWSCLPLRYRNADQ